MQGENVIPLSALIPNATANMITLIHNWERLRHEIDLSKIATGFPLAEINRLAPVRRPGKVLAIGLNYAGHVAETGNKPPENQLWFSKASTSIHPP